MTAREVSSERVSKERLRDLKERAGLKCVPTQMTYEARKAANGLPSEINEHFFARNWEDKPHRVVFDLCEEIEHLSELLALRSSVKTVGPTPDQVLDAANDYAMEQYGMGFLNHPVDRQRILSSIEAPAAASEVTDSMVQKAWEAYDAKGGYCKPERFRAAITAALKGDR